VIENRRAAAGGDPDLFFFRRDVNIDPDGLAYVNQQKTVVRKTAVNAVKGEKMRKIKGALLTLTVILFLFAIFSVSAAI
jgi:hypothetical protein